MEHAGNNRHTEILHTVGRYYTEKVREHGATPRGVDWRDAAGQEKRFDQLLRDVDTGQPFTIAEVGCGYGALAGYLRRRKASFSYTGYDLSPAMVESARAAQADVAEAAFHVGALAAPADYVVASGIFNVRFLFDDAVWLDYVLITIDAMVGHAKRGASFNVLTSFSDADRKEGRLWYPDPGELLRLCLSRYGRRVALYHDYGMYEFTISIAGLAET